MQLSIIIVSWNVRNKLRENLKALLASQVDFDFEIIVVDNNSEDGSAEMVKQDFPAVDVVENDFNVGFARANNQVLKHLDSPHVLLLNPDMRVNSDTLANMMSWIEANPQASVASCRLADPDGQVVKQVRRFPRLLDQLSIVLKLPHFFPKVLDGYILSDFDYANAAAVDSVRGAFFWLNLGNIRELAPFRASTLPWLDERYFLWFEEVDYCRQIKKAGGEVRYTPAAVCTDLVGQSFKQVGRGRTQCYFRDSMLKYFQKWHPTWQYWLLRLAWPFGRILTWLGLKIGIKK